MAPRKAAPEPTEDQEAHTDQELAVGQYDAQGNPLKGRITVQLEALRADLDAALADFENTADNHDHDATVRTLDGVADRLNGLRTRVADIMREAAE